MQLDDKADHFFTAAISGCTFQVTGPASKPVVSHGNAGTIDGPPKAKLAHMNQHLDRLAKTHGAGPHRAPPDVGCHRQGAQGGGRARL